MTGYEEDTTENIISHALYMVEREKLVEKGDILIFTAGDPATNEVKQRRETRRTSPTCFTFCR